MIKASELRIGNYLDRNGLMEVRTIHQSSVRIYDHYNKISLMTTFPIHSFKGIELTPEWLERFGLIKEGEGKYAKYYQGVALFGYWTADGSVNVGQFIPQDVKYVHQLQNLFFALTGRELELKK